MTSSGAPTPERKPRKTPRKQSSNVTADSSSILQSIASKSSSALLHPQVTLTCYIPTNSVGAVIGRRGSTILQIQKQAQQASSNTTPVRVSIVGHDEVNNQEEPSSLPYTYSKLDFSCPHWTPVVIRASPCAALAAALQLSKLVEGDMDEVVLDLPISRSKHAALVGRKSIVLANLSADTGVRIMVPRKDLRHDVVQLEGDLDKVKVCLERVLTLASNERTRKGNAKEEVAEAQLQESVTVTLLPPQTKWRQISRKTDTSIRKKKVDDEWVLTVTGTKMESVQAAIGMLVKWNEESADRPPPRRRRPREGRKRGRGGGGGTPSAVAPTPITPTPPTEPSS